MTNARRQSHASQLADAAFLMALLFGTLFVTTFVFADDGTTTATQQTSSIENLPISDAEKQQYHTMVAHEMIDEAGVQAAVEANQPGADKYDFSWLALILTVAIAALYLGFVYRMSFSEYRDVIASRFGTDEGGTP